MQTQNSRERNAQAKEETNTEKEQQAKAKKPRLQLILPSRATEVRVAIIDDDEAMTLYLSEYFGEKGFKVSTFNAGEEALNVLASAAADSHDSPFDLIFSDVQMPRMDGIELTRKVKTLYPEIPIVLVTAFGEIEQAVNSIRDGAFDYLEKPLDMNRLEIVIRNALDARSLRMENQSFRRGRFAGLKHSGLLCKSPVMETLYDLVSQISDSDAPVLIQGERGAGKSHIASIIHQSSRRADRPLMEFDCSAVPESLQESALFHPESGVFLSANDGTLLLKNVDELGVPVQAKLLHAIQEKAVRPLGSDSAVPVNVRVIASTNGPLEHPVSGFTFREDLYFLLSAISLHVPPLRARPADIQALAEHFLTQISEKGAQSRGFTKAAAEKLRGLRLKGNVKELRDLVERSASSSKGAWIDAKDIPVSDRSLFTPESMARGLLG